MMDISSKRWRIRSIPGGYGLTCRDAPSLYVFLSDAPSADTFAAMTEDQFNAWCIKAARDANAYSEED